MSRLQSLLGHCMLILLGIINPLSHSVTLGDDIVQTADKKGISVVSTDPGDVHIGITLQQYEAALKRREKALETRFINADAEERQHLETQLHALQGHLQDTRQGYQEHIEDLTKRIAQLASIRGKVSDELLSQTQQALADGNTQQFERLLDQMATQTTSTHQVTAEVNYQRCQVAKDELRYRQAFTLCQQAVQSAPDRTGYLSELADLAHSLGDYHIAVEYYEQALASYLKSYGEDHPDVAIDRNNLGMAWLALGEYEKAIAYLEKALASDLKIYGEDHLQVATYYNNLGGAWHALGDYKKAYDYLALALAGFEKIMGANHPSTRGVRANYQQLLADIQDQDAESNARQ